MVVFSSETSFLSFGQDFYILSLLFSHLNSLILSQSADLIEFIYLSSVKKKFMQIPSVENSISWFPPPFSFNVAAHDTAFAQGTSIVVPSGYCTLRYQQLTLAVQVLVVNRTDIDRTAHIVDSFLIIVDTSYILLISDSHSFFALSSKWPT